MILFSADRGCMIRALSNIKHRERMRYEREGVKTDSAGFEAGPGRGLVQGGASERDHSTARGDRRAQGRPAVAPRPPADPRAADPPRASPPRPHPPPPPPPR